MARGRTDRVYTLTATSLLYEAAAGFATDDVTIKT